MAYISSKKFWESEFDNIVSWKDTVKHFNLNQLRPKVNETCKEDEKITTNSKPTDNTDVINKGFLDEELYKVKDHISNIPQNYIDFESHVINEEEILIERSVKTTFQIPYDVGFFGKYDIADDIIKDHLLFEVNERGRLDLEEVNDIIQWFYSNTHFEKQSNIKHKKSTSPTIFVSVWYRDVFTKWTTYKWRRNK